MSNLLSFVLNRSKAITLWAISFIAAKPGSMLAYPPWARASITKERAIVADSRFAPAYAGLAMTYQRSWSEPRDPHFLNPATLHLAEVAVRRALDLDPGLADGHAGLGLVF